MNVRQYQQISVSSGGGGGGLPPVPTFAQLQNVQTNIGNTASVLPDGTVDAPILNTFVMSADAATRRRWYEVQRAAGSLHYPVAVKYFYHSHDYVYDWYKANGRDWNGRWREWVQLCAEILGLGGFKVLHIFWTQGDGNWHDPNSETRRFCDPASPTYGPRMVDAMREACVREGLPDLTTYAKSLIGWEPDPRSIETCIPVLRQALGPDRDITLHLQQGYGNPTGDGAAFWQGPVGQMISSMFFQSITCIPGDLDRFGQPAWWDNLIQHLNRLLPTGTPLPGTAGIWYYDAPSNTDRQYTGFALGPDWFGGAEKRANFVYYEGVAYYYTWRKPITPFDNRFVQDCAHQAKSFGVQYFGNGVPR